MTTLTHTAIVPDAVASVAASASPAAIATDGISPEMAALLAEAEQKEAAYFAYQRAVLDPAEQRHAAADDGAAEEAAKREWDAANDHFDMLVEQASAAQLSVCHYPVTTAADLRAKLAFIVQHQMGGGMDWNATLLADAERIAATPVATTDIAVSFTSSRYPADVAPPLTFDPAAPMSELLDQRTAVAAWMDGNHTTEAEESEYCNAINGIENVIIDRTAATPADALTKLIVLVQACAENADVLDTDAIRALVDARRHFGLGYVHDLMLAQIGLEPVIMPAPVAEADMAWARAKAEWQAVRQDLQAKGLSDEQVDVLTEREMQAYCNLAELPLRGIGDAATKLRAMIDLFDHVPPDPLTELLADMTRLSAPQPQGDDGAILDAFAGRRREFEESYHLEMATEQSNAYFDRCDAYEAVIHGTPATTIAGVIAKLRVTFLHQTGELWSDRAVMDPAHPVFVEGLAGAGIFVRQAWSAIEDLARIGAIDLSEQGR